MHEFTDLGIFLYDQLAAHMRLIKNIEVHIMIWLTGIL